MTARPKVAAAGNGHAPPGEEAPAVGGLEGYVNLDIFAGRDVRFSVPLSPVEGADREVREYLIPNDVPFATALKFQRIRDLWMGSANDATRAEAEVVRLENALTRAGAKTAEARLAKSLRAARTDTDERAGESERLYDEVLEAFLEIVKVRQPEATMADLARVPQGAMLMWHNEVLERLSEQQMAPWLKMAEGDQDPKAKLTKAR